MLNTGIGNEAAANLVLNAIEILNRDREHQTTQS